MSNLTRYWGERGRRMKRFFFLGILVIFLVYLVPLTFQFYQKKQEEEQVVHTVGHVEPAQESQAEEGQNAADTEAETEITVSVDGHVRALALEDYVAGAVAAEMPASFPAEALKAQAVAARTYAVYKQSLGQDEAHPDAVLCDDYTHCAAFVDLDSGAQALWGSRADEWSGAVRAAAADTAGVIVTYGGQPIAAVFHAAAAQQTEAAVSVWGTDIPYLSSVESDGDEACPDYDASVTFGAEEFRQILLRRSPDINLTGLPETWFTDIQSSEAGGVTSCRIGGESFAGTEVRALLGLNSTHFTVSTTDTSITFHTEGYGHGVGMSQYGARRMAEEGAGYADILLHYYSGAALSNLADG